MDAVFVAGIGASAGGVKALKEFFQHVPGDGGIAYVAILHLSPEYDSQLAELLQLDCPLPVVQVQQRVRIAPDRVYVIPPNQSLTIADGFLALSPMLRSGERRAPIDIFLRTLADSRGARSACVLLSGSGSDGSMGLKRVKERGGICLVQDPAEAEYGDMPRNAIGTGLVDHVLPVRDIPARIVSYARSLRTEPSVEETESAPDVDERALRDIFSELRVRTGHDFINYKRSTMWRRLQRRVAVHELADVAAYSQYLRTHPEEAHALLKDLLISVTDFFRDRQAFEVLEARIIPKLFDEKGEGDHVRVWVAGCATGEEAYSIAILLAEHLGDMPGGPTVQVFATDIDEDAIATAREALYTVPDTADISAERLRRFFVKEGDSFRVRKELREMVLFARHNVIKDPPFSHLDLVTCRNLLIYLNRAAQHRVLDLLHFALNPGGYLFLGSSESVDGASNLFVLVEKDANIYQSRHAPLRPLVALPEATPMASRPTRSLANDRAGTRARTSYADLHQRLLEEYAPPSIVVDEDQEILHLTEGAARFLQFAGGEPSTNLLKVIRRELRLDLRTALYQARQSRTPVEAKNLRLTVDGEPMTLTILVRPVLRESDPARGFFLVVFERDRGERTPESEPSAVAVGEAARQLEDEVLRLRGQLRATVEQHEVQAEELKASNEELQAMNEELRSTAEELETSKEELQSVNEELTTVNQELKIKIEEQFQANNDIQNLINTTAIAAIFLDRSLRIKLYTPPAHDVFNLIASDRGRPLSDISTPIEYPDLQEDIRRVLERLERIEREVRTRDDRWFLMQIRPYRTSDDRIDGVVLTFTDVTQRKQNEARLAESESRFRAIVSQTTVGIGCADRHGRLLFTNDRLVSLFGWTAADVAGRSFLDVTHGEDSPEARELFDRLIAEGRPFETERRLRLRDGEAVWVTATVSPIRGRDGQVESAVAVVLEITQRRQHEEALRRAHADLEDRVADRTRQLRQLLNRLISVQEDERRRIARDLHDDIGQKMTALQLRLDALRRQQQPATEAYKQAEEAQAFVQQLDRDLDFFTGELRPAALYDLGLSEALRDFLGHWAKTHGIAAHFEDVGFGRERVRVEVEVNLYRIAQEALNNVHKHARATKVEVVLQRRDDNVVLSIEDDGVGLELSSGEGHRGLGLASMRERAALMGGVLEVERAASGGTVIIARVPALAPG